MLQWLHGKQQQQQAMDITHPLTSLELLSSYLTLAMHIIIECIKVRMHMGPIHLGGKGVLEYNLWASQEVPDYSAPGDWILEGPIGAENVASRIKSDNVQGE